MDSHRSDSSHEASLPNLQQAHARWLADFNARRSGRTRKPSPPRGTHVHVDDLDPSFTYRRWVAPTQAELELMETQDAPVHDTVLEVEEPSVTPGSLGLNLGHAIVAAGAVGIGYLVGKWWSGRQEAAAQVHVRPTDVHGDEFERVVITKMGDENGEQYLVIPAWAVTL